MITYEGISPSGEKVTGKFIGSKQELINYLKSENIILISIKEEGSKNKVRKLSLEDIYENFEQLYYLLSAGLKIDKAIYTIIKSLNNQSLIEFWEGVLSKLKEGKHFSTSLKEIADYKHINIPKLYINIISVGESVGDIKPSLKTIIEDIKFKQNLKKEIKNAISYPLFLLIMSFITIFIVVGFILPKFAQIFSQEEIEKLPIISKFTISLGIFLHENYVSIIFILFSLTILISYIFRMRKTRQFILELAYKIPYISSILISLELSNIFSSLSTLLKGGLHINKAVQLTTEIATSKSIKNILQELQVELKKGNKISHVLSKYHFIPYDATVLIAVGEESGKLEEILKKLSEKYITDFKDRVSKFISLLEPTIIVIVGIVIGIIVISILLSVLSVSDVF